MWHVDTVVGQRWLLSLLRTEQPCDAQPAVLAQVSELLAKGANFKAVNQNSRTALHIAAFYGHEAVVREPPGPGARRATGIQIRIRAINGLEALRGVWIRWWACGGCSACFAQSSLATRSPRLRRR